MSNMHNLFDTLKDFDPGQGQKGVLYSLPALEKAGVQTWRYQDGFLHEKAILVDDYCGVGTANFDNRSFRLNFEITLLFAEASTVRAAEAMVTADFARSTRAAATDFTARPWWFRLAARTSRLMAPVQ